MKAHDPPKSTSGELSGEMCTGLGHIFPQRVADSQLVRISLTTTAAIVLLFCWTRVVNLLATSR